MSIDATKWAWSAPVESASQRVVLLALADRAGEEHTCWPSTIRIQKDTCLDLKTVKSTITRLVEIGLLADTGERKGATGRVRVLRLIGVNGREEMNPKTESFQKRNDSEIGSLNEPKNGSMNRPKNGSQNLSRNLSKNLESTPAKKQTRKTAMPVDFGISESVKTWAASKGFDRLEQHLEAFKGKAIASAYTYANWDQAFMNAIREDWAKLRGQHPNQPAQPERQSESPKPNTTLHIALAGIELELFKQLKKSDPSLTESGIAAQARDMGISAFDLLAKMKRGAA